MFRTVAAQAAEAPADPQVELAELYHRHRDDVVRLALRYGGGRREWAEDVVQDVFVTLARALPDLDDHRALAGWLYRVTTRRCLNRLEAERVRAVAPLAWLHALFGPEPPRPDAIAIAKSEIDRALTALATLPPKERVAFAMHRLDDRTVVEIAETMGHTKGYVSKLIARAEAQLTEVLR